MEAVAEAGLKRRSKATADEFRHSFADCEAALPGIDLERVDDVVIHRDCDAHRDMMP